jgi:hypothetical protein
MKDYRYILVDARSGEYVHYYEGFPGDEGCEPDCYFVQDIYSATLWVPRQNLPPEVKRLLEHDPEAFQWIKVKFTIVPPSVE